MTQSGKAVAAVKEDKAKALDMFNKGEGGCKDRDALRQRFGRHVNGFLLSGTPYRVVPPHEVSLARALGKGRGEGLGARQANPRGLLGIQAAKERL